MIEPSIEANTIMVEKSSPHIDSARKDSIASYQELVDSGLKKAKALTTMGIVLSLFWVVLMLGGFVYLMVTQALQPEDIGMREWLLWLVATSAPLALLWLILFYVRSMQGMKLQMRIALMRMNQNASVNLKDAEQRVHTVAVTLLKRADELARAESTTSDKLRNMVDALQHQTETIRVVMTDVTSQSKSVGSDYAQLIERIQGMGSALEEHRRALGELVESSSQVLSHSETQAVAWSEKMTGVVDLAKSAANGLGSVREVVNAQARDLEKSIATTGSLSQDKLSSLQQTSKQQLENLEASFEQILDNADTVSNRLQTATNQMQDVSQWVSQAAKETFETIRVDHEGLAQSLAEAREMSQGISQRLKQHFSEVDSYVEQALRQIDEVIGVLGDDRSGVVMQLQKVFDQVEGCTDRFTTQAANLVSASKNAHERADELEARHRERHQTLFVEAAGQVLEVLHSHSLDISRMIGEEITDADLRHFMSGDRTIFTRALVKRNVAVLARVMSEEIRSSSQSREYVLRFMGQFEEFLQQTREADQRQIVLTSILASDLGRLYMILNHVLES